MDTQPFKVFPASQEFAKPEVDNLRQNIIAGPNPQQYWNHSPGIRAPMEREEGPFPVEGNIGELIRQEANNQYKNCTAPNSIGGSPNCTDSFIPDYYTSTDTCGGECVLKSPESLTPPV